jgi:hypothetical protein
MHIYKVRPRKDHRGVDLVSDALPFGRLWYGEPNAVGNAIGYAKFRSRSHDAVIRVYDSAGNVIETPRRFPVARSPDPAACPCDAPSLLEGNPAAIRIAHRCRQGEMVYVGQ